MVNEELFFTLLGIVAAMAIVFVILAIVTYVLRGIIFFKIAKEENIDKPWLAWVPIGTDYLMLKTANMDPKLIWVFIATVIMTLLLESTHILIVLVTVATLVISFKAYSVLCKKYDVKVIWFGIGLIILPVLIIGLIILNKKVKAYYQEVKIDNGVIV